MFPRGPSSASLRPSGTCPRLGPTNESQEHLLVTLILSAASAQTVAVNPLLFVSALLFAVVFCVNSIAAALNVGGTCVGEGKCKEPLRVSVSAVAINSNIVKNCTVF